MINKSIIGGISLGSLGVVGTVGIAYKVSDTTIEKLLKEDLLDVTDANKDKLKEDWKSLQEKANSKSETRFNFEGAKNTSKTPIENGDNIRKWCETQRKESINNMFNTEYKSSLLALVKELCIRTMKDKIGESDLIKTSDSETESKAKTNITALNTYSDTTSKGDVSKDEELNNIKTNYSSNTDNWKKLIEWCEKKYKSGYKNSESSDNLKKLIEGFCKKTG